MGLLGNTPSLSLVTSTKLLHPISWRTLPEDTCAPTHNCTVQDRWTRSTSAEGLHKPALQPWRHVLNRDDPDQPTSNPLAAKYWRTPLTGSDCHFSNDAYRWAMCRRTLSSCTRHGCGMPPPRPRRPGSMQNAARLVSQACQHMCSWHCYADAQPYPNFPGCLCQEIRSHCAC